MSLVKQLEGVQITAARKVLGPSNAMSNTALRAELGVAHMKWRRAKTEIAI